MRESALPELTRLHTLLDPNLPAWQQLPSDALIWTQAGQWAANPEKKRLAEAKTLPPSLSELLASLPQLGL